MVTTNEIAAINIIFIHFIYTEVNHSKTLAILFPISHNVRHFKQVRRPDVVLHIEFYP